jgi:hypothetical protein
VISKWVIATNLLVKVAIAVVSWMAIATINEDKPKECDSIHLRSD